MGQNIRGDAAVDSISSNASKTLQNADARGGVWKDLADQRIGPAMGLFVSVEAQLDAAREVVDPLAAKVAVARERAGDTIGKVSDDLWNAVGRPAGGSDPALAILFPGGISYYVDGDTATQPDRMDVLAQLLISNLHPKISAAAAQAAAGEVQVVSDALRAAVEAARAPLAQAGVLERVRTAVGRSIQLQLGSLKRLYKAAGFTEAEIHTVIPSRPRRPAAKPAPKPAPKPAAPAPDAAAPAPSAAAPASTGGA